MKILTLLILMAFGIVLMSLNTFAVPSQVRTDYFPIGGDYFADNIENGTIEEISKKGLNISDGNRTSSHNWTNASGRKGCWYSNTSSVTPFKGDFLINCTGSQDSGAEEEMVFNYVNSSFRGKLGFAIYPVSGFTNRAGFALKSSLSFDEQLLINDVVSSTKWACNTGVCDANLDIDFDVWTEFVFNFTNGNLTVHLANGTLVHNFTNDTSGTNGFGSEDHKFLAHGADSKVYFDDIWMSAGDRPEDADRTTPLINISLNNTALSQGLSVNITGNSSDETGLSLCQISLNQSGFTNYYNFSLSGTSGFCSQNITIANVEDIINFTVRVNDTSNNFAQDETSITLNDVTAPVLNNCTLSSTSITDASGNTINLTCEATDASSNIQTMVATLNGTINKTLTFSFTQAQTVNPTYVIFESLETLKIGSYSVSQVNITDTSSNKLSNTTRDLHFEVTSAPSGGGTPAAGGGGGGAVTTTIINLNGTPLLSFGIAELSFFVITTPSQSEKIVKFKNIGNVSFEDGEIGIQGSIEPFIKAKVCDLNISSCKTKSITLKPGQNAFLVVDGNFTSKIEVGVAGIIRLDGNNVFDLPVVVDRPPLYNKAVLPFVRQGFSEPVAYVIGYSLTSLIVIGSIMTIRSFI